MVTAVTLDYEFPKYTKIEPRHDIEGGAVEAIVGTKVTVHATTNEPASRATLNLTSQKPAPMTVSADDPHQLTGKFKVTKTGTYTINFRTTGGQLNPNPVVYDVIAIEDRPPTARFVRPDRPSIKVPSNVKVDFVMTGSDDHGVKDATLHVVQGNEPPYVSKNVLEGRPAAPEFRSTETLDLAPLRLKPGSSLTYWLTVRDNREPSSNKVETPKQLIEIVAPVSPPEQKQIEEKQKKDREQFEQPPAPESEPQEPQQGGDEKVQQNPGGENDKGNPGEENGSAKGAGRGGKGNEKGDQSANPDQGANNNDPANSEPQENEGNGSQSPANDARLRQIENGLRKEGLLNKDQNKGNPPPRGPNDANPQKGTPGEGSQPPSGGAQNPPGNQDNRQAGNQNQQRPRLQNPNPAGTNPPGSQAQTNPGESENSPQVQRGQKDPNQPQNQAGQQNRDNQAAQNNDQTQRQSDSNSGSAAEAPIQ